MLLLCYHYDPSTGKYGAAVIDAIRIGAVATMLASWTFLFVSLRKERDDGRPNDVHEFSVLSGAGIGPGRAGRRHLLLPGGRHRVLLAAHRGGVVVFAAIYHRRRHEDEVGAVIHGSLALELLWTIIPFVITMVMFGWGAKVFFDAYRAARRARWRSTSSASSGCGRSSTWTGSARSTSCTSRSDRPVKLIMGSEDVLHSFYIPAFRVKADVDPWPLQHAVVHRDEAGQVPPVLRRVLRDEALGNDRVGQRRWSRPTSRRGWAAGSPGDTPAAAGEKLFTDLVCISCHRDDAQARGPPLKGLFGHTVQLQGGGTVVADEAYIRESIVNPQAKIVNGFQPIMPTFQGLVTEEQLLQLDRLRAIARCTCAAATA